jgi:hypothetical protein
MSTRSDGGTKVLYHKTNPDKNKQGREANYDNKIQLYKARVLVRRRVPSSFPVPASFHNPFPLWTHGRLDLETSLPLETAHSPRCTNS